MPFLHGAPLPTNAARCRLRTEVSALTSVAWTGWWSGNGYNQGTGIAVGRASAGASGGRDLGPNHASIPGVKPLHLDLPGHDNCPIRFGNGSGQSLEANLAGSSFISQTAFSIYAVLIDTLPTAGGAAATLSPHAWMELGQPFYDSGTTQQQFKTTFNEYVDSTHYHQIHTTHVRGTDYTNGALMLYEIIYDATGTLVSDRLKTRINNGSAVGGGTPGNAGMPWTEAGPGVVPWTDAAAFTDAPKMRVCCEKATDGLNPSVSNFFGCVDLYELLVTNTVLGSTPAANVRAALMTKYGIP